MKTLKSTWEDLHGTMSNVQWTDEEMVSQKQSKYNNQLGLDFSTSNDAKQLRETCMTTRQFYLKKTVSR